MAKPALGPVRLTFQPWNDASAQPYLRYENVGKSYGDVRAVENVDLEIYKGEFFALLGPSGCGKTTLMRLLAGFERPDTGRIVLDGEDITKTPAHLRTVNMMFQSYALFPHLSVEGNIAFGLKQEGLPQLEISRRVEEMLALVKMENLGRRKPHQLSGGQQQRVALARSLAKRPKVLLLDEPLAALDKKLRDETQYELMHLQSQLQMTFIIVTHDQEEAMILADRVAVMDHGRIVQVSTPAEIYENPKTRHVAEFVGEVNIFEGKVVDVEGKIVTLQSAAALLKIEDESGAVKGEGAFIAVRPEKIKMTPQAPQDVSSNAVQGEVWDIGYLGDFSVYHIRLADGTLVKAASANARRRVEQQVTWGDRVWLSWDADAGVLLGS
ncbi:MAG: ABC transporter ATP-binding protein [Pseudomonadota bacterium]